MCCAWHTIYQEVERVKNVTGTQPDITQHSKEPSRESTRRRRSKKKQSQTSNPFSPQPTRYTNPPPFLSSPMPNPIPVPFNLYSLPSFSAFSLSAFSFSCASQFGSPTLLKKVLVFFHTLDPFPPSAFPPSEVFKRGSSVAVVDVE